MSAHGIPGAFSSALSVLWKGILIIVSIFLLSKLFVFLFPDFGQSNIKNKVTNYYEENQIQSSAAKSEYDFNILDPKTWTYEALLERQKEVEKNGSTSNRPRYARPILVPTIDEWNEKNNPAYKTNYYENQYGSTYDSVYENKDTTQSEWYTESSMWK